MSVRSTRCSSALLASLLAACCVSAQARVLEEQLDVPVQVTDSYNKRIEQRIKVTVWSDDAQPGPKPVIVINHGRAGEASERASMGRSRYAGPDLPKQWFEAFRAGGASAEFVQMPPHGDDGHQLFAQFPDAWKPAVAEFLRKQGFDMKDTR